MPKPERTEQHAETSKIVMLPIGVLYPHPDNPRKDVGDVTELAESIQANGVLQNLTVVPNGDRYTVIIGHRRLAAARKAGLHELPCIIARMTEKEQLSTMLTENMQRVDLTVYEQAKGFQLMFDMGDSVDEIARKSGFSKSTVRKRLEIAKLDDKTLKKVSARQIALGDFEKLAKIDDMDTRNKVLGSMGTPNFKNELQIALKDQDVAKCMAEWLEVIKTFATEDPNAGYQNRKFLRCYGCWNAHASVVVPDDADSVKYYYKVGRGQIEIYTDIDHKKEDAEAAAREEKRRKEREEAELWDELNKRHYKLRADFVKGLPNKVCKQKFLKIIAFVMDVLYDNGFGTAGTDAELLSACMGIPDVTGELEERTLSECTGMASAIEACPEKALLCMAYSSTEDMRNGYWKRKWANNGGGWETTYEFEKNPELDRIYRLLEDLGYERSDEEIQMQQGAFPKGCKY